MRSNSRLAYVAAGLLLAAGPVLAQGNPSADSIINSLRPGASMSGSTRGIRPVAPSEVQSTPATSGRVPARTAPPRTTAAGAAAGAAAATQTAGAPSINLTVQFATNSADLTPAAMRTLDELGRALSSPALAGYRFRIEGHTDNTGNHDHNVALSEQRAAKVVDYLTSKFSVDRSKVESVGKGPDAPLVAGRGAMPEPRNRRVTVVNIGA